MRWLTGRAYLSRCRRAPRDRSRGAVDYLFRAVKDEDRRKDPDEIDPDVSEDIGGADVDTTRRRVDDEDDRGGTKDKKSRERPP